MRNCVRCARLGAAFFGLTPTQQAGIGRLPLNCNPSSAIGRILLTASHATSLAKQYSDELQVNYSSDNLNVTFGGLWFKSDDEAGGPHRHAEHLRLHPDMRVAERSCRSATKGVTSINATSLAAYAQLEYKVTPELELVVGGRMTNDKKSSQFRLTPVADRRHRSAYRRLGYTSGPGPTS